MNFNPFPAIPRIARGQGISNLRGVYTVCKFETCQLEKVPLIVENYTHEFSQLQVLLPDYMFRLFFVHFVKSLANVFKQT